MIYPYAINKESYINQFLHPLQVFRNPMQITIYHKTITRTSMQILIYVPPYSFIKKSDAMFDVLPIQ